MKKNVMTGLMMLFSTIIFAQRHAPNPQAMASKSTDRMKTELSLNDDQYVRVKAITEKFLNTAFQIRRDTSLSQGQARTQMKGLKTAQEAQLKNVLTADQWTKWTALKAKRKDDRKNHHHGKGDKG
jgi:periplasmic protein CpxP/Spy